MLRLVTPPKLTSFLNTLPSVCFLSHTNEFKMHKTENLRDLLTELARSHDFEPKMLEQKVFVLWRKILGTPLGTRTVPVFLSDGVLKIYTEYPPFKQELLLLKQKIIADLNAELGQPVLTDFWIELRQVHKATSHHTKRPSTNPRTSTPRPSNVRTLPPKESEQIEQATVDVTDTDLKISLRQLFMTQSKEKS
ncbi:DUF721 domain-containing protein [Candidatus Poribacteria bacterium]|nr:DUF721 domain-containing protein [Candidatus Poribacteria bacterium]MYG08045.1 DUF721 domain-containing protein [Candidatus Poribacteria bacterium]MYK22328.1 DUF721 domain-containing protein [Candidatus Poribacteria bacterium]